MIGGEFSLQTGCEEKSLLVLGREATVRAMLAFSPDFVDAFEGAVPDDAELNTIVRTYAVAQTPRLQKHIEEHNPRTHDRNNVAQFITSLVVDTQNYEIRARERLYKQLLTPAEADRFELLPVETPTIERGVASHIRAITPKNLSNPNMLYSIAENLTRTTLTKRLLVDHDLLTVTPVVETSQQTV